jgi:hypothetical protein
VFGAIDIFELFLYFVTEATGMPCFLSNLVNTRVGKDQLSPDRDIQQATVNAFADMGVQPGGVLPRGVIRVRALASKYRRCHHDTRNTVAQI